MGSSLSTRCAKASPQQIGRKGLSNHRWIVGGKLCLLLNQYGLVVAWACATANTADNTFQWLIRQCEERMIILSDMGFHAAEGDQSLNHSPIAVLVRLFNWTGYHYPFAPSSIAARRGRPSRVDAATVRSVLLPTGVGCHTSRRAIASRPSLGQIEQVLTVTLNV